MYQPLTREQYNSAIKSGFSSTDIISMEKKRKALAEEKPGYFSSVASEYKNIGEEIVSGVKSGAEQIQRGFDTDSIANVLGGATRGALRTVGGVAKAAFTPIVEAPIIKQGLEAVGAGIAKIPGIETIIIKATELAKKHPESAKDLMNIIDIATLGGGKAGEKPVGAALEKTGIAIERSGLEAANIAKNKFAIELIKPVETKATKLAQVSRTTESGKLFKKDIVQPTEMEQLIAKEIFNVPGLSEKNTFQKNFNLTRDYNIEKAKTLEADIAKYDFTITRKEVVSKLNQAANDLKNNPLIVGDAQKMADRLINGAKKIINENKGTGSGLLKARKEYDSWVLSQKPKAFDATADNAFTVANKSVRDTLNTVLDENAVNLGIKDSLRSQSRLYQALENIAPKAAEEANTEIGRIMQSVGKTLGTKNKIVQAVAAAAGIGGLGAAATFAPAAAVSIGSGYVIYRGGRLIMSPEVRTAVGRLLQQYGRALNPADRSSLQGLIDTYNEVKNDQRGFIKIPGISKGGKSLSASEAVAKGISKEEWIKGQGTPVFRGGETLDYSKLTDRGISTSVDRNVSQKFVDIWNASQDNWKRLGLDKIIGKEKYTLHELLISPDAKIATRADIPPQVYNSYKQANPLVKPEIAEPIIGKWAKANGFDAIDYRTLGKTSAKEAEIKILNPDILKTRSQLSSLYDNAVRATPKTGAISAEQAVAKGISKEEWIKGQGETFYRGEGAGKGGNYFTKDKEFANEFAGIKPLTEVTIPENSIYRPKVLPEAVNEQQVTKAISEAKKAGFKATYVSEGSPFGEPIESVFVFDKSALKTRSELSSLYNKANKK